VPVFVASAVCTVALGVEAVGSKLALLRRVAAPALGAYAIVVVLFSSGAGFPLSAPTAYLSVTLDQINLHDNPELSSVPNLHVNVTPYWETMWLAYFLRDQPVTLGAISYYSSAPPQGEWYLERADAPLAPGAEARPVNLTYRLVRMPS
jgi:hypothetical protein